MNDKPAPDLAALLQILLISSTQRHYVNLMVRMGVKPEHLRWCL